MRSELTFELADGDPTDHMPLQQFVLALFQIRKCCLRALLVLRSLCLQLSFGFVTFGASLVQEFDQARAFVVEQRFARRCLDCVSNSLIFSPFPRTASTGSLVLRLLVIPFCAQMAPVFLAHL